MSLDALTKVIASIVDRPPSVVHQERDDDITARAILSQSKGMSFGDIAGKLAGAGLTSSAKDYSLMAQYTAAAAVQQRAAQDAKEEIDRTRADQASSLLSFYSDGGSKNSLLTQDDANAVLEKLRQITGEDPPPLVSSILSSRRTIEQINKVLSDLSVAPKDRMALAIAEERAHNQYQVIEERVRHDRKDEEVNQQNADTRTKGEADRREYEKEIIKNREEETDRKKKRDEESAYNNERNAKIRSDDLERKMARDAATITAQETAEARKQQLANSAMRSDAEKQAKLVAQTRAANAQADLSEAKAAPIVAEKVMTYLDLLSKRGKTAIDAADARSISGIGGSALKIDFEPGTPISDIRDALSGVANSQNKGRSSKAATIAKYQEIAAAVLSMPDGMRPDEVWAYISGKVKNIPPEAKGYIEDYKDEDKYKLYSTIHNLLIHPVDPKAQPRAYAAVQEALGTIAGNYNPDTGLGLTKKDIEAFEKAAVGIDPAAMAFLPGIEGLKKLAENGKLNANELIAMISDLSPTSVTQQTQLNRAALSSLELARNLVSEYRFFESNKDANIRVPLFSSVDPSTPIKAIIDAIGLALTPDQQQLAAMTNAGVTRELTSIAMGGANVAKWANDAMDKIVARTGSSQIAQLFSLANKREQALIAIKQNMQMAHDGTPQRRQFEAAVSALSRITQFTTAGIQRWQAYLDNKKNTKGISLRDFTMKEVEKKYPGAEVAHNEAGMIIVKPKDSKEYMLYYPDEGD